MHSRQGKRRVAISRNIIIELQYACTNSSITQDYTNVRSIMNYVSLRSERISSFPMFYNTLTLCVNRFVKHTVAVRL